MTSTLIDMRERRCRVQKSRATISRAAYPCFVRPPERGQVPAEIQFEVARNAVPDIADLGTARLCTGQGQHREEQVVARLKLGSCRRPEPIDLGLRSGQCFTVERGQTPDERIDKRVEVVIVDGAVPPARALGDTT